MRSMRAGEECITKRFMRGVRRVFVRRLALLEVLPPSLHDSPVTVDAFVDHTELARHYGTDGR